MYPMTHAGTCSEGQLYVGEPGRLVRAPQVAPRTAIAAAFGMVPARRRSADQVYIAFKSHLPAVMASHAPSLLATPETGRHERANATRHSGR
jgi:hypothetical protein